jgi:chromosome segregation ATPase
MPVAHQYIEPVRYMEPMQPQLIEAPPQVYVRPPVQIVHKVEAPVQAPSQLPCDSCPKLKVLLREKEDEITLWKQRFADVENECKRLRERERLIRELEERVLNLEEELRRSDLRLREKDAEIESWRAKHARLESNYRSLEETLEAMDRKLRERDQKIYQLESENQRLQRVIKEKDSEIDTWRSR